jgi:hypothetical protein
MFSSYELFCKSCGTVGKSKRHMPGSILIEIILWCCFVIPGLVYTIWRHGASKQVCKKCRSKELIPKDSPVAKQMLGQMNVHD